MTKIKKIPALTLVQDGSSLGRAGKRKSIWFGWSTEFGTEWFPQHRLRDVTQLLYAHPSYQVDVILPSVVVGPEEELCADIRKALDRHLRRGIRDRAASAGSDPC